MIPCRARHGRTPSRKPRASGDDPTWQDYMLVAGKVNPARAGMIPATRRTVTAGSSKPRASGDDPAKAEKIQEQIG